MRNGVLVGGLLMLACAAAGAQEGRQPTPLLAHPLDACGDDKVSFDVDRGEVKDQIAAPAPGSADLYIVELFNLRDKGKFGRPTLKIGLDGKWLGAVQGFTYLMSPLSPGEHHLCARWQSHFGKLADQVSLYDFTAEEGQRYYVRAHINVMGDNDVLSMDLEPVSTDEGRFLISEAAKAISKPKH